MITKDLTFDLLRAKNIRLLDIWDFAKEMKQDDENISLDEFLEILMEEVNSIEVEDFFKRNGKTYKTKYYCLIIEEENQE